MVSPSSHKRIQYLDITKGFAMICVILGHLIPHSSFGTIIYSFHMPLFFFIVSGILYKGSGIKKQIVRYLKPYLFLLGAFIIFDVFLNTFLLFFNNHPFDFAKILKNNINLAIYASDVSSRQIPFVNRGIIWFLPALLVANLLTGLVLKIKTTFIQFIVVIMVALIGFYSSHHIRLPLAIQPGCIALLFVYFGKKTKRYLLDEQSNSINLFAILCLLIWLLAIVISLMTNTRIDFASCVFPHLITDIIGALGAGFVIIHTFRCLHNRNVCSVDKFICNLLSFFGIYSLVVYCFHAIELRFPWFILDRMFPQLMPVFITIIAFIIKIGWAYSSIWLSQRTKALRTIFSIHA